MLAPLTQIVTFRLKTSRDFNGLGEVSFIWDLHDIPPAALEILRKNWSNVFDLQPINQTKEFLMAALSITDLSGTGSRRSLVLRLRRDDFFSSFSNELAVNGLALYRSVESTENASAVTKLSRASVWIHLSFRSRTFLRHVGLIVVVKLKRTVIGVLISSLIWSIDQIVLDELRYFRQSIVSFENGERLRQEL